MMDDTLMTSLYCILFNLREQTDNAYKKYMHIH